MFEITVFKILFWITSTIGMSYFLFRTRGFDYISLAFFSAIVYFMPGYFGFVAYMDSSIWVDYPIGNNVYGIFSLVLLSFILTGVIFDLIFVDKKYVVKSSTEWILSADSQHLYLILSVLGLIGLTIESGVSIFSADKVELLGTLGRSYILFSTSVTIGILCAYAAHKKILLYIYTIFLIFDLYLGFRTTTAFSLLAILTLYLSSKGNMRLLYANKGIVLIALLIGSFFLIYKSTVYALKAADTDLLFDTMSDPDFIFNSIVHSEAFTTQAILNSVVQSNFHIPITSLYNAISQFILFSPELGIDVYNFNDEFQPKLFPDVEYGMAANVWAEMWSLGGVYALITFLIFYNCVLYIGSSMLKRFSVHINIIFAPVFVSFAFYLHRNDLSYSLNIAKRFLLVTFLSYLIIRLLRNAK